MSLVARLVAVLALLAVAIPAVNAQDEVAPPATTRTADRLILSDTFDDSPSGFLNEASHDPEVVRYEYRNSRFVIESLQGDFTGEVFAAPLGDFTDVTIAIDGRVDAPGGDLTNRYLTISCRFDADAGNGYQLEIRPLTAEMLIWRQDGDVATPLANIIVNGGASFGEDYHRFELSCTGDRIIGSFDSLPVLSASDGAYSEGWLAVGGGVYPGVTGGFKALFDNLAVSVPAESAEDVETGNVAAAPEGREDLVEPVDELLEITESDDPVFGPEDGTLVQAGSGFLAPVFAGVDLADLVLRVEFEVPDLDVAPAWDFGIAFRNVSPEEQWRLILRSDATWHLALSAESPRASGVADALARTYGARNVVELVVSGGIGHLLINSQFVARLDLSPYTGPGDLWIGTGIFPDYTTTNAEMPYQDFTIWELESVETEEEPAQPTSEEAETTPPPEPTAEAVVEATPEQAEGAEVDAVATPEAAASPAISTEEFMPVAEVESALLAARESTADAEPLEVAESGIIIQSESQMDRRNANVTLRDSRVTVRFISPANPREPDHPWDLVIGFRNDESGVGPGLVIKSEGIWEFYASAGNLTATGVVSNLIVGPNQFNDIELLVQGEIGYLAVNGVATAAFELPPTPESGDIWLSSGSTEVTVQAGVATSFTEFTIWSLDE